MPKLGRTLPTAAFVYGPEHTVAPQNGDSDRPPPSSQRRNPPSLLVTPYATADQQPDLVTLR